MTLSLTRRALLGGTTALLLATPALAEDPLKVALLVPGLTNDGGFNQSAREAMERLAEEGLVAFELREQLADPATSEPIIRQYAARGYDLVIGHGIELSDPILNVATAYPDTHFAASGGMDLADRLLPNVDGWTYDFAQLGYLAGFVAANLDGVEAVGMVGGPELPFIAAAHAGFKSALAQEGMDVPVIETYTDSFDDAQRAAEATRGLVAQGANLIWTSGDGIGNGVAIAASQEGAYTLGVTGDAGGYAAKVNIMAVDLDMYPTFGQYVSDIASGEFGGDFLISGIGNAGLVATEINHLGSMVPADFEGTLGALVGGLADGSVTLPDFN